VTILSEGVAGTKTDKPMYSHEIEMLSLKEILNRVRNELVLERNGGFGLFRG
jgi:uncharacterized protein involved in exopolysaccharide biosynthesis